MVAASRSIAFIRIGFALVVVGLVASVFVLLTLQAAYSPLSLPLPTGPFEQLASEAFRFAGAAFLFVALVSSLKVDRDLRGIARLFSVGAFSKLAVLAFAAINGMMAIQATDPRSLAPKLFFLRLLTNAIVLASLGWAAAILLRSPATPGSSE